MSNIATCLYFDKNGLLIEEREFEFRNKPIDSYEFFRFMLHNTKYVVVMYCDGTKYLIPKPGIIKYFLSFLTG